MNNLPLAANVTFVGLTVVFLALIILTFLIFLFTRLISKSNLKKLSSDFSDEASILELDEDEVHSSTITADSEEELIAVLTAAVYASAGMGPEVKLRVTGYKRIGSNSPVWNSTGRRERIASKL